MKKDLKNLKTLYKKGENIIQHLRNVNRGRISPEDIKISYDLQAGSYIKKAARFSKLEEERGVIYSEIIQSLGSFNSILEVGIGEGTTFLQISKRINNDVSLLGFDFSFSRLLYAKQFLQENKTKPSLFLGDMYNAPLLSNSVDVVYTNHTLEPNGGNESKLLKELYRITNKFLVLLEPIYELSSASSKEHMDNHGYVKNLYDHAKNLNFKIIDYRLLFDDNNLNANSTGVIIIEKNNNLENVNQENLLPLSCPVSKTQLELINSSYYSSESLLLYPVIEDIPILVPENAIVAANYKDFLETKSSHNLLL